MSTDIAIKGTPVCYDDEGRPVSPRWAPKPEPDYLGYYPCIAEDLVSCICRSETFFHLRWGYFNDEPESDDGLTMCGRKRTQDMPGFWMSESGHCGDCAKELKIIVEDIGDDCGWIEGVGRLV